MSKMIRNKVKSSRVKSIEEKIYGKYRINKNIYFTPSNDIEFGNEGNLLMFGRNLHLTISKNDMFEQDSEPFKTEYKNQEGTHIWSLADLQRIVLPHASRIS